MSSGKKAKSSRFDRTLKRVYEIRPDKDAIYSQMTDLDLSKLFSELYNDSVRFNTTAREWYRYDSKRGIWTLDEGGMSARRCLREFARAMNAYVLGTNVRDDYISDRVGKLTSANFRETLLKDARPLRTLNMDMLDRDENLLNCQNVAIDLSTGKTIEHSPDLLLSKVCNARYDESAQCPRFLSFYEEIMLGDREEMEYLHRVLGLCLTADASLEKFWMLYGESSRNGKSTLIQSVCKLLNEHGGYAENIQPETLELTKNHGGSAASPDIAKLRGVRLLHVSEPRQGMRLNVGLMKDLTGGDTISARELYGAPFDFTPTFKLLINTNHLPVVTDNTLFKSDRCVVVPFLKHFDEGERDTSLKAQFTTPQAASAILNWLLEGLAAFRDGGLTPSNTIVTATRKYDDDSDRLKQFMKEMFVEEEGKTTQGKRVYKLYTQWCGDSGFSYEGKTKFYQAMKERGFMRDSATIKVNGQTLTDRNVVVGYRPYTEEEFKPARPNSDDAPFS